MAHRYGFLDESGDLGQSAGSSACLIVSVVLVPDPRQLRRIVKRARRCLGKRLRDIPEIKAQRTPRPVVERILRDIAELDADIVAVVLEKQKAHLSGAAERWYSRICALAVQHCLEHHPVLALYLDKRYTNPMQRRRLSDEIMQYVQVERGFVAFEQVDSQQEQAIQAADAVAWAFAQKYERADDTLYRIIADKVIVEDVVTKRKRALPGS